MHKRFLSWLCFFALAAVIPLHAQTTTAAPAAMPPGMVLVAKVSGTVTMLLQGVQTPIKVDDRIPQTATVITGQDAASSVVLVFSNGATTQLGSDTELVIEEYLQDPFASTVRVADMVEEPSVSRTKLKLNRGELVGNVKKLQHSRGSSFTVQTPVGAAGIRGTTFRIVFRPSGTGQAFFQLSTADGNVGFSQGQGGGGTDPGAGGGAPAGGTDPGAGGGGTDPAGGGAPDGTVDIPVPQGQEITVIVTVTTDSQGQLVATAVPSFTGTTPISASTMALVTEAAQQIAVAAQQTTFTSPTPTGGGGGTGGEGSGGTTTGESTTEGGTSGSTTGSTTGGTTPGDSTPPSTPTPPSTQTPPTTPTPPTRPPTNPPPPPTQPPRVTTGDGG
ncbi:MAG: FecR domain-containing protein [Opitutus sp.]